MNQDLIQLEKLRLVQSGVPLWVTIIFKGKIDLYDAREILTKFHRNLDRKLLGRKYNKIDPALRTKMIGYPEGIGTENLHYHILVTPPKGKLQEFINLAENIFKKIYWWTPYDKEDFDEPPNPNRTLHYSKENQARPWDLVELKNPNDRERVINYSFKEQGKKLNQENTYRIDLDFHKERSKQNAINKNAIARQKFAGRVEGFKTA